MQKNLINECRVTFSIKTEGPILIKKQINKDRLIPADLEYLKKVFGLSDVEKLSDSYFVRTSKDGRLVPYIPGSSMKGVIRSHCERICKTLMKNSSCNPFQNIKSNLKDTHITDDFSCTGRLQILKEYSKQGELPSKPYTLSCPVCKLFGNGFLQSRTLLPDGYGAHYNNPNQQIIGTTRTVYLPRRDGVGIDRYSGGAVSGVKFDFEVEENAVFLFQDIIIKNFDLWQLGLLAYIFQDFEDKLIKIGFGKSRGLGNVSGMVEQMQIVYYGNSQKPDTNKFHGIAKSPDNIDYYTQKEQDYFSGYGAEIALDFEKPLVSAGYRHYYSFPKEEAKKVLSTVSDTFSNSDNRGYLNGAGYEIPEEMRISYIKELVKKYEKEETTEAQNG